jgi:ribonuclease G
VNYELIIDAHNKEGVVVALLNEGKLIELHHESESSDFMVGDIYHGKVKKIVPSLNAAFVDVGYDKDAFLHYHDLGPQFPSMDKFTQGTITGKQNVANLQYFKGAKGIEKDGAIADVLTSSRPIVVQIDKEPISTKGPRLTSEITLAGRYIVLVPFSDKISISQKIEDPKEKERLKRLMSSIKPKNFGVIIRTVAQNRKVADLDQDLRDLTEKWDKMYSNLKKSKPKDKILGELDRATGLLRDILNENFSAVHVNDEALMEQIKTFVSTISPGNEGIVKLYDGKKEIFERFTVNKQIKALFGKKVQLPSGGYLIIEHTEAMHVVDVNSGNRKVDVKNQEDNALKVNIEAATELARVMRLRDMGGIVCVDFIDMHQKENNKMLFEHIKTKMSVDRAKHNIVPPSRFGVVEITRQRVRPVTEIKTAEGCPTCGGTGEIQASITYADEIDAKFRYLLEEKKEKHITLQAHPFIAAYYSNKYSKGKVSRLLSGVKINVEPMDRYHILEYYFKGKNNKKLKV